MPTNTTKLEKVDFKQAFLEKIAKDFGPMSAIAMEDSLKEQKKQIGEFHEQGGTSNDFGKSIGIPMTEYQTKPASSPFGFGGMSQQGGTITEQQPGLLAGLLSTLITGNPKTSARMDLQKLVAMSKIQQDQQQTKGVYGFDPLTGKTTLQATVPASADVRNLQPQTGIESLPIEMQPVAQTLARKLYGVRGAEKGLPGIVNAIKSGMTPDKIEDSIRMSTQSPEFSGAVRNAAQMLSIDDSESVRNSNLDALDDYVQNGDMGGAKDFLKEKARSRAGVEQANKVAGKERTIELLDQIGDKIKTLEQNGQSTGFIAGNIENMVARVGKTVRPEFRELATEIATAIIEYRRYATGVNFSVPESREYKIIFPNIDKAGNFNSANISGLKNVFSGDLKMFYRQKMGKANYDKLFPEEAKQQTKSAGFTPDKAKRLEELRRKKAEGTLR
jgi:hypothetical protein